MKPNKLIQYALSLMLADSKQAAADLSTSEDKLKEAIAELKTDYVLVPVDDPGLRMVETEIDL